MNQNYQEILTSLIQETITRASETVYQEFLNSVSSSDWVLNKQHQTCRQIWGLECRAPLHSELGWAGRGQCKRTGQGSSLPSSQDCPWYPVHCQPGCRDIPACLLESWHSGHRGVCLCAGCLLPKHTGELQPSQLWGIPLHRAPAASHSCGPLAEFSTGVITCSRKSKS